MSGAFIISERKEEMSYELFGDLASLVAVVASLLRLMLAASLRWPLNNRGKVKEPLELLFLGLFLENTLAEISD